MADQTTYGKAFEFACALAFFDWYKHDQPVHIQESKQLETAKEKFYSLPRALQQDLYDAATAAVKLIEPLEPRLLYHDGNVPLTLALQTDAAGQKGDVRDVLCLRINNSWEIGLSCKHNHAAVKHSRLSDTIDFGKEWFGRPCSLTYFNEVVPLFSKLRQYRDESAATGTPMLWRDVPNKYENYYVPILKAFMDELGRLSQQYPNEIPSLLLKYLIGKCDFYKVITDDAHRVTKIQVMNLYGTLHQSSSKHNSIVNLPALKMPKRFFHIGFKPGSSTTIEVVCDEGWAISMRLHNAKSTVEPSLKFDVQLESLPQNIHTEIKPWSRDYSYSSTNLQVAEHL